MELRFETASPDETRSLAGMMASALSAGAVVGLQGDLGAGKTEFVRGMAETLAKGDTVRVHSPSFVIMEEYETKPGLVHVDLYRISEPAELETIGLDEVVESGRVITVIEWFERARGFGLPPAVVVEFEIGDADSRTLRLSWDEESYPGLDKAFTEWIHQAGSRPRTDR